MFGDPNFLGAATLPALCLLSGYRYQTWVFASFDKIFFSTRSLQLKNGYSEELELSSILLQIISKQVKLKMSNLSHKIDGQLPTHRWTQLLVWL